MFLASDVTEPIRIRSVPICTADTVVKTMWSNCASNFLIKNVSLGLFQQMLILSFCLIPHLKYTVILTRKAIISRVKNGCFRFFYACEWQLQVSRLWIRHIFSVHYHDNDFCCRIWPIKGQNTRPSFILLPPYTSSSTWPLGNNGICWCDAMTSSCSARRTCEGT